MTIPQIITYRYDNQDRTLLFTVKSDFFWFGWVSDLLESLTFCFFASSLFEHTGQRSTFTGSSDTLWGSRKSDLRDIRKSDSRDSLEREDIVIVIHISSGIW